MREGLHSSGTWKKRRFRRKTGPGLLGRCRVMIIPLMVMTLSACDGRGLIPDSMIPQALKGEQTDLFTGGNTESRAGNSDQSRSLVGTEAKKTSDMVESTAAGNNQTETGEKTGAGSKKPETESSEEENTEGDSGHVVYVHVCGHVRKPGVYQLSASSRICDAISAAGGMDKEADPAWWNQAAQVTDGMQIRVPSKKEVESGEAGAYAEGMTGRQEAASADSTKAAGSDAGNRVNINTASVEELITIPGIGAKRAEDILRYREEHGKFSSVEDIKNVPGIGDGIYSRIKDHIRVD